MASLQTNHSADQRVLVVHHELSNYCTSDLALTNDILLSLLLDK